jgi:hypothetical protein
MVKIDVYVAWRSEFARSQLARRIRANLSTETPLDAYIASPEDIVLAKLDWYRKRGCVSDRQWRDILGVLKPSIEERAQPQTASTSAVSIALSKALKKQGWKFVGPTTVYAFMQAMGLINDHAEGCVIRPKVEAALKRFKRPCR